MYNRLKEAQLKLYCYSMLSDGDMADAEMDIIKKICKEMHVSEEDRDITVRYCVRHMEDDSLSYEMRVINNIRNIHGVFGYGYKAPNAYDLFEKDYSYGRSKSKLAYNRPEQIKTIWNLINLGYADGNFSAIEQDIVKLLAEEWKLSDEILQEFMDTAETIEALVEEREWYKTTDLPYDAIKKKNEKIENDIRCLMKNVQAAIDDADIQ